MTTATIGTRVKLYDSPKSGPNKGDWVEVLGTITDQTSFGMFIIKLDDGQTFLRTISNNADNKHHNFKVVP